MRTRNRKEPIMKRPHESNAMREDEDGFDSHQLNSVDGFTVECLCPRCGVQHKLKLLWTGRGKPKKFCPPCKIFAATIEPIDFCGFSGNAYRGLEKTV
jgi:hypothetical protein